MNLDNLVLAPLYKSFGTDALLKLNQTEHAVRVIDQTSGIEIEAGGLSMPSVKPVAMVRATLLSDLGVTSDQLLDATVLVNGMSWTIKNVRPKPGAGGKSTGELMLVLINGDL